MTKKAMIDKLPPFPFSVRLTTGEVYIITKGSLAGRVNYASGGYNYTNHVSENSIIEWINDGSYTVVGEATPAIPDPTAQLSAALEMAKELEATLLRIKGMFA